MKISDDGKLTFKLPTFEGPLDLLLHLIKKNEMDIYDIPMSKITSQYIDYLHQMQSLELDIAGEYLVIAAMLVNIKSKMLLPSTNAETMIDDEDVIDPREELVEHLIEYQKFKKLSDLIEAKQDENDWNFERNKVQRPLPFDDENLWEKVDTWDLLEQMQKIFKTLMSQYTDQKILDVYEEISVNEKITLMRELLEEKNECMFTDLLVRKGNILDVICAFMAILEAVKFKMAAIYQNRMFGDIKICRYEAA